MKILMISEKDAANESLSCIATAFKKRGHKVYVYAPYWDENVQCKFRGLDLVCPLEDLDKAFILNCDMILASSMSMEIAFQKGLLDVQIPFFTYNYLIHDQATYGGDLCFVSSLETTESKYYKFIKYPRVAVGDPKYDDLKKMPVREKDFLFIDSGHYPFGQKGKRELAQTILKICYNFPDYHLIIKPRFLPNDAIVTHRNSLHIYDMLRMSVGEEKLPSNLVMLTEHGDLNTLIESSHTVITMYTSAFAGVCAARKNLVILDGIPSEDVYDVRLKNFERTREIMKNSGALVHYKKVLDYLPNGIRIKRDYIDYLFSETSRSSEKIVRICEFLHNKYFSKGIFPHIQNLEFEHIFDSVGKLDGMTWNGYIGRRYQAFLLYRMISMIDFHIKADLRIDILIEASNTIKNVDSKESFLEFAEKKNRFRDKCIIGNSEKMMDDEIDAGILLNAYYGWKKYESIRNFKIKNIGSYFLYNGFVEYDSGNLKKALEMLKAYIKISSGRDFIKEISDMSGNRFRAYGIIIEILMKNNQKEEAIEYFEHMKEFYFLIYPNRKIGSELQEKHYNYIIYFHDELLYH